MTTREVSQGRAGQTATSAADERPFISVVRGSPTDAELAAVVAVLALRSAAAPPPDEAAVDTGWAAYWRATRAPLAPGPGAWRASSR